jgi:phytoene desaturase
MVEKNTIIIGSGVAGMATAIRLAVKGFTVTVYEKNSGPGGKLTSFEQQGFKFDAGPSLFTQPQNIQELFELAQEPLEKYFTYQKIDIACKYFYNNGKIVNAFTDKTLFAEELKNKVNEEPANVYNYLKQSETLYKYIGNVFLNYSLHKRNTWLHKRAFTAFKAIKFSFLFQSLSRYNHKKFKSLETAQLFNRYATYNGSNPFKAPAMLSLIPHLEQNEGAFYPQGGMISITNALYKLAVDKGVQFHFNTPVNRIIHHESKVTGVVVNGINHFANTVVSNVDIYFTFKNLLFNNRRANIVLKQERSSSAVIFYWGIKKVFTQLELHNIFFTSNYQQEFANIFTNKKVSDDPTIYINITSTMQEGLAPTGMQNWFVMVNAPANVGQNWDELKIQIRANVIKKLSQQLQESVEELIVTEHTLDPVSIEQNTSSFMGSLYGTSSNSKLAAFFRHPNFSSTIKGLYFCGGSVHPGGGIPLCLKSAKIVSDLIHSKKTHQPAH